MQVLHATTRLFLTLCVILAAACRAGAQAPIFEDSGDKAGSWEVFTSEGVTLTLSVEPDPTDGLPALRLGYDFKLGSGYAGIRRRVGSPMPKNYELRFDARSDLPDNNLETKLVSPDGLDVWWVNRRAMELPRAWTTITSRARHFQFAWGPSGGTPLEQLGSVEIVLASAEGGKGSLWLRNISFRELPVVRPDEPIRVEFFTGGSADARTGDADEGLCLRGWHADTKGAAAELTLHLVNPAEIGGLELEWAEGGAPEELTVEWSDDKATWRAVRTVRGAASTQFIRLGEFGHPWVRLVARAGSTRRVAAERVAVIPVAFGTPTAFATYQAQRLPRGRLPRGFYGEQSYWTVIGVAEGRDEALMSEDGAVEVGRGDFSIEPFLEVNGRVLGWNESTISHSLARRSLPIPTVTRRADGLVLRTTCFASGAVDEADLFIEYQLTNEGPERKAGKLVLAARPYQVNPPTQWLNLPGGAARIDSVAWQNSVLSVNARGKHPREVLFGENFREGRLAAGDWGDCITPGAYVLARDGEPLVDDTGGASAAAVAAFELDQGATASWWVTTPLESGRSPGIEASALKDVGNQRLTAAVDWWRENTTPVRIQVPRPYQTVADTAISTLAYVLINKDGAGIQPGSRNYERSWMRDGSLTSAALLSFGHADEVRRFIEWFGARQFASGAIPCVVDRRGPDPVAEHDSHGQFLWLVWNYYRHTGDVETLKMQFPAMLKAAEHIQHLRQERLTDEWISSGRMLREPGKAEVPATAFSGLVPASISHEGYSAKPMHSYWDDSFCLLGLRCAQQAAKVVGDVSAERNIGTWAGDMAASLDRSVVESTGAHGIDFMPGCVELGDFDPTSTTITLWPCHLASEALTPRIRRTFDRNWEQFVDRRDASPARWKDYTPYELRQVGSYVILGEPERAAQVLDFHMGYRRPAEWNQWAEVVRPDLRTAGFVGDMPHTWCGSDFLNSLRIMFAYERPSDGSVVLLGGIPKAWIQTGEPIGISDLGMPGGRVSVVVQRQGDRVQIRVDGTMAIPSGGVRVRLPTGGSETGVTLNGKTAHPDSGEVRLDSLPSTIDLPWADRDSGDR